MKCISERSTINYMHKVVEFGGLKLRDSITWTGVESSRIVTEPKSEPCRPLLAASVQQASWLVVASTAHTGNLIFSRSSRSAAGS